MTGRFGTPVDIGGLLWWYRADQGITIATGVSQWNDLSGSGRTLVQAAGTFQPLFVAAGTPNANSRATVRFDGVNDLMVASGALFPIAQPVDVFLYMKMVSLQTAASGHTVVFSGKNTGTGTFYVDSTPQSRINFGTNQTVGVAVANTVFSRVEVLANGASSTLVENDNGRIAANAGTNGFDYFSLGDLAVGTEASNVEIADCFAYSRSLSAEERFELNNYMRRRYEAA